MNKTINTCYLCGSKSVHHVFTKLSHEIWLCDNCHLYTLKFDYDYDKFIHDYYQKGYFTGNKKLRAYADYEGDKAVISLNMRNYLRKIRSIVGARRASPVSTKNAPAHRPKLLDCGCAMGFFMEEANRMGFDAYGVDISKYAAERAQYLFDGKVKLGPVEKVDKIFTKEKFDVITMFDLIEHLKDPILVIKKLKKLLNNDGIIVLQTGDVSSNWARRQGQNWHFFAPPQHLHFFSRDTITKMLESAGFKVIKIETEGKWVSLRYLFHMMRYANKDRIGDFFYKLTHKNIIGKIPILFKFGDNMIVFAKKI